MFSSPIYWMVPQMVKALPPLSRRRDKPKSASRMCPRKDHFLYVMMSMKSQAIFFFLNDRGWIFICIIMLPHSLQ